MRWTIADVDAALPVVTVKRNESIRKGDTRAAQRHQAWIDRLLDIRQAAA